MGATGEIAAAMGWSLPYTLGVLGRWKMAEVYCQAVLCHDQRIALDDDDGIVFKIDLVTSPVGAAENCEHVMALVKRVRCVAALTVAASAELVNMRQRTLGRRLGGRRRSRTQDDSGGSSVGACPQSKIALHGPSEPSQERAQSPKPEKRVMRLGVGGRLSLTNRTSEIADPAQGWCPQGDSTEAMARRASSAALASAARRASSAALASAARRASSAAFASCSSFSLGMAVLHWPMIPIL